MGKFNTARWAWAGIAAGLIMWLCEGAGSMLYMAEMEAAMKAHNLAMDMSAKMIAAGLAVSLVAGFTLMFFYAACLPRLGSGAKPAMLVASVLWAGGYLLSLAGYQMLGLFSNNLLLIWGAIGLVEMNLAALAGARIYRDA